MKSDQAGIAFPEKSDPGPDLTMMDAMKWPLMG